MPKLNKNDKKSKDKQDFGSNIDTSKIQKPLKKTKKLNIDDSISKSKQLSQKLKNAKTGTTRSNSKNTAPRLCGNGEPMPSLAELEKMFEDSDDENRLPNPIVIVERCKTPEQKPPAEVKPVLSPCAIKDISNKMLEIISNLPDPSVLVNEVRPLPPIVPPKKRRKPDKPYIVGCKDRPKVIKKSNVVIGKGDDDYGVDYSNLNQSDDENQIPKKRKRQSDAPSLSKSIFNPLSDEIATMLNEYENAMSNVYENTEVQSDGSVDSNKTVAYDCNVLSPQNKPRSFSPLPSTSKDNETFLKNDMRFHESLLGDSLNNDSSNSLNDVEILEMPCETVIIDESVTNEAEMVLDKPPTPKTPPTIDLIEDDLYSSIVIDVDQSYGNSDCEVIDVDNVIAENKTIIDKYKKNTEINVTHVNPSSTSTPKVDNVRKESLVKRNTKVNKPNEDINKCKKHPSIENIVNNFFNEQSNRSEAGPSSRNMEIETVDLSSSTSGCPMKELLGSIINFAQSFSNTFIREKIQKPNNSVVTDSNNLNISNRNDDSVIHVSSSLPEISVSGQTSNVQNRINDDSVVLVNSSAEINTNISSTFTLNPTRKKQKSKTVKISNNPPPLPSPNQKTPINIGDCPICMDNMSNNTLASTKCGHIFCMPCIQAALKAGGKKCPTCRKVLRGVGYHQLFL